MNIDIDLSILQILLKDASEYSVDFLPCDLDVLLDE